MHCLRHKYGFDQPQIIDLAVNQTKHIKIKDISFSAYFSHSTHSYMSDIFSLFSVLPGSFDCAVFIWDIGGRKGTVYELHGHRNKVTAVKYFGPCKKLVSVGEDTNLVMWDLGVKRIEVRDQNAKLLFRRS